jgi:hypothetical protein
MLWLNTSGVVYVLFGRRDCLAEIACRAFIDDLLFSGERHAVCDVED